MRKLPPLSALPAFEATARLGSVTSAANELGRTHGAVSKQIRHLAEDLGGDLFEKDGNGLKLTARGDRLRRIATSMLDELNAVSEALRAEVNDSRIDIVASATLATRWLTPRLPRFYAEYPDIEVRLLASGPRYFSDYEFDVLLSYDRLRGAVYSENHISLGDTAYGPVCAPGYPLRATEDGWEAPVRLTQQSARHVWDAWRQHADVKLRAERDVEYPHHFMALEAAAAGLGVALAEKRLVASDLAIGRLVAPLGFGAVEGGLQAVVTPRARDRPKTVALLNWLIAEAGRA